MIIDQRQHRFEQSIILTSQAHCNALALPSLINGEIYACSFPLLIHMRSHPLRDHIP